MKTVIFDFDGVVAETELKKHKDLRRILESKGIQLPEAITPSFIGKKTEEYLRKKFGSLDDKNINEILELRNRAKFSNLQDMKLIKGIINLLGWLSKRNKTLAICSGSPRKFIREILRINGIEDYFEIVVSGEDFSSSKPNPECYKYTMEKLGTNPSDCIIIEDSIAGILAGKEAGAVVYAIQTYFSAEQLTKADRIFKNHVELLEFLKSN